MWYPGQCRPESIVPEDPAARPFTRPVIRLPSRGVIFTRILIDRPETSMVIRLRPGWDAVAHFLETGTYEQAALPATLLRYGCSCLVHAFNDRHCNVSGKMDPSIKRRVRAQLW